MSIQYTVYTRCKTFRIGIRNCESVTINLIFCTFKEKTQNSEIINEYLVFKMC